MFRYLLFFIPFITTCNKTEKYCNTIDPLTELSWLKNFTKSNITILECTYNLKEGFYIRNKIDSSNNFTILEYRNCEGVLLYQAGGFIGTTFPNDFENKITFQKQIYPL